MSLTEDHKNRLEAKEIQRRIRNAEKETADLRALVDTLQATLRRADTVIHDEKDREYVFTQAGKWAINAKI